MLKNILKNTINFINEKITDKNILIMITISLIYGIIYLIVITLNSNFYTYFFDEFYYLDCTKHLAFGYVDHPPFSIYVLFIWTKLFGTSLLSIRFLTTVFNMVIIFVVSRITSRLGGKLFSQILSSVSVMMIANYMAFTGFYSMNVIEILICNLCIYLLIVIVKEKKTKLWLLIGILIGIGLLNKHTIIIYIISIILGLLFTKERIYLFNRWFVFSIIIAFFIFLPNLIWQIDNNFPSLIFYKYAQLKIVKREMIVVLLDFIIQYNPVLFIFWFTGIFYLLFKKDNNYYQGFGLAGILLIIFILWTKDNRTDRILSIFPVLISSGFIFFEKITSKKVFIWVRGFFIIIIVFSGLIIAPTILPILEPETAAKYYSKIGYRKLDSTGYGGKLSFSLGTKTGWEEMVKKVAEVYNRLPENEKKNACIFGPTYWNTGAISFLGKKYGLPEVICSHNNYYLWGIDKINNYDVIIAVYHEPYSYQYSYTFEEYFEEVESTKSFIKEYAPYFAGNIQIVIYKKPKEKTKEQLRSMWESFKMYL